MNSTVNYYEQIFKRKSFHLFRNKNVMTSEEYQLLESFIAEVKPLYPEIKTVIKVVREEVTTCKRGAEYCILFYSEKVPGFEANIGYLGEQIDLYLSSQNIGALWYGIGREQGKIEEKRKFREEMGVPSNLEYVIMIAIRKQEESSFRKDMFKAKRKKVEEIWKGETKPYSDIVRFAPSACNTQPWKVDNDNGVISVYRYKKPGFRGIMPVNKVSFYNAIDIGIFLYFMEVCMNHENETFERNLYKDTVDISREMTLIAEYTIK